MALWCISDISPRNRACFRIWDSLPSSVSIFSFLIYIYLWSSLLTLSLLISSWIILICSLYANMNSLSFCWKAISKLKSMYSIISSKPFTICLILARGESLPSFFLSLLPSSSLSEAPVSLIWLALFSISRVLAACSSGWAMVVFSSSSPLVSSALAAAVSS